MLLCAGALAAVGRSNVTLIDSVLDDNIVKDYAELASGGACFANDTATLALLNGIVRNNVAQELGGGIAMGSKR